MSIELPALVSYISTGEAGVFPMVIYIGRSVWIFTDILVTPLVLLLIRVLAGVGGGGYVVEHSAVAPVSRSYGTRLAAAFLTLNYMYVVPVGPRVLVVVMISFRYQDFDSTVYTLIPFLLIPFIARCSVDVLVLSYDCMVSWTVIV